MRRWSPGCAPRRRSLRAEDRVAVWEFDDTANAVRPRRGSGFLGAVEALGAPRGGTDIDGAIAAVLRLGQRDILLVTDGQSHALDVQALARSGRRFGVVLIGAGSLEARVGHLAALTGGELLVAGDDAREAVRLAFAALAARRRAWSRWRNGRPSCRPCWPGCG